MLFINDVQVLSSRRNWSFKKDPAKLPLSFLAGQPYMLEDLTLFLFFEGEASKLNSVQSGELNSKLFFHYFIFPKNACTGSRGSVITS